MSENDDERRSCESTGTLVGNAELAAPAGIPHVKPSQTDYRPCLRVENRVRPHLLRHAQTLMSGLIWAMCWEAWLHVAPAQTPSYPSPPTTPCPLPATPHPYYPVPPTRYSPPHPLSPPLSPVFRIFFQRAPAYAFGRKLYVRGAVHVSPTKI